MKFYKCSILEDGWCICTETYIEYLWASNEEEARNIYCKRFHFRKNKKGLKVEEIAHRYAKRIYRQQGRWVKYTHYERAALNNLIEEEVFKTVNVCYCGNCNKEIGSMAQYCKNCNSEMEG